MNFTCPLAPLAFVFCAFLRRLKDLTGEPKYHNGPSLADDAISKIALLPIIPVVRKGARSTLEHHHLWKLRKQHATANAWQEFSPVWEEQKKLPEYVPLSRHLPHQIRCQH